MAMRLLPASYCASPSHLGLPRNGRAAPCTPYRVSQSSFAHPPGLCATGSRGAIVPNSTKQSRQGSIFISFLEFDGNEDPSWWASKALPLPAVAWLVFELATNMAGLFMSPGPLPPFEHIILSVSAGAACLSGINLIMEPDHKASADVWLFVGGIGAAFGLFLGMPVVIAPLAIDALFVGFIGLMALGFYALLSVASEPLLRYAAESISGFKSAHQASTASNEFTMTTEPAEGGQPDFTASELQEFDKLLAGSGVSTEQKPNKVPEASTAAERKLQQQNAELQKQVAALQQQLSAAKVAQTNSSARNKKAVSDAEKQLVALRGDVDAAIQKIKKLKS